MADLKSYWNAAWATRKAEPANAFAKHAYAFMKSRKPKYLLEVGCGDGQDAIYFANKGLEVTAVDLSRTAIVLLQSQNKQIKSYVRDVRTMQMPKNSFDVIYAHLSLHYFDDKTTTKVFERLLEMLKPGGLIFIKCKSTDDTLYGKGVRVGKDMYRKDHVRHFFTKEYMREKLLPFHVINIKKSSSVYRGHKSAFIEAIAMKSSLTR